MKEASKEFLSVLSMGGCLVTDCICGRTHFATNDDQFDDGELEKLREMAKKEPTRYIEDPDSDTVYVATFRGVNYVPDCPCGRLASLEELLWDVKDILLQYYRLRIDKEKVEKATTEGMLAGLSA